MVLLTKLNVYIYWSTGGGGGSVCWENGANWPRGVESVYVGEEE